MHLYSAQFVAEALRITYRKVNYWLQQGYIPGVPAQGPGTGHNRQLTLADAVAVAKLAQLNSVGMTPRSLGSLCAAARHHDPAPHVRVTVDLPALRDRTADQLELHEMELADARRNTHR